MSWDAYTKAVIRLSMPDGDIEVAPAPLGRTVGTYPEGDRRIHIVTAHNPGGKPASATANDKGHARLLARIMDAELAHFPAAGGDRAWTHVEAGVAIVGLDDVQAREIGREFGRDAIFEWSSTALAILSCTERRVHYTGWTATPVQTATETSPPPDAPVQDVTPSGQRRAERAVAEQALARLTAADRLGHIGAYFRRLSRRTGSLFSIIGEDRDEPTINVVGTGSSIEIQQPDTPARVIADVPDGLADAVLALSDDESLLELTSGAWNAGDIAFALGSAFRERLLKSMVTFPLVIDSVEWNVWDSLADVGRPVLLPEQYETPPSCLIASCQWKWVDGAFFSPASSQSGTDELLQVGPLFVSRGDEWANVLDAKSRKKALREFERGLPQQEGLEQVIFIEPEQLD